MSSTTPLLDVAGLTKHFPIKGGFPIRRTVGAVQAVDGLDFTVAEGESLGLVGESGCGKSTTGRLITRLLEPTAGSIKYRGNDIAHASRRALAPVRSEIQMIFQDPYASLNPRQTVGKIIAGPMEINDVNPKGGREARVRELLETVGLNPEHYNRFPHEFSGGQRQRIGVARALALEPKLIVADEPVSALDVSIQAQVVNLLQKLQRELGIAFVFIAHDLAVVRHFSQRVAVMYLGRIVEIADRDELYGNPRHPYTRALLSAVPEIVADDAPVRERIRLAGDVPSPVNPPSGCRFRTRCWKATEKCATQTPPLVHVEGSRPGHLTACHYPEAAGEPGEEIVVQAVADLDAVPAVVVKEADGTEIVKEGHTLVEEPVESSDDAKAETEREAPAKAAVEKTDGQPAKESADEVKAEVSSSLGKD